MEQKLVVELSFECQTVLGENDKGIDLSIGDKVVVYIDDTYGIATVLSKETMIEHTDRRIYRIIRKVSPQDLQRMEENKTRALEACKIIEQKVLEYDLPLKVVSVKYSFDRSRLSVYYTSEGHVDFRPLVRDLSQRFQTHIQMEQIGPRDETRLMGGIGVCGLVLCCHRWLPKLESISVGMAKTQQLSLNIPKLSGPCNKLKCCLSYEYSFYKECTKQMPTPGTRVKCSDGEGKVLSLDCIKGLVTIAINRGEAGTLIKTYSTTDVQQLSVVDKGKQQQQQKQPVERRSEKNVSQRDSERERLPDRQRTQRMAGKHYSSAQRHRTQQDSREPMDQNRSQHSLHSDPRTSNATQQPQRSCDQQKNMSGTHDTTPTTTVPGGATSSVQTTPAGFHKTSEEKNVLE